MTPTKELIDQTIKQLPEFSDEQLVHYYKCSLSRQLPAEKPLFTKLIKSIESERKSRNKIQIITEDQDDTATNTET